MQIRINFLTMFTCSFFLLTGCDEVDGSADDGLAGNEYDDPEQRQINGPQFPPDTQFFEWVKGMPPVAMGSPNQRSCFLTGFNGALKGNGDGAVVSTDAITGNWTLYGKGATTVVRAACVSASYVSANMSLMSVQNTGIKDMGLSANRACFVQSVEGPVNGDLAGAGMRGVMIRLDQSGTRWHLESYGTGVKATARCFGYGTHTLSSDKFWKTAQGPLSVGAATSPCFITRVFGNFSSPDDRVGTWVQNINNIFGQWLGGLAASNPAQIGVRCLSDP